MTAGESHGPALVAIVEGIPAGLPLETGYIDRELARRQRGYGRGPRMGIEEDSARILSGVRLGRTLGSPICLLVANQDFENWSDAMSVEGVGSGDVAPETKPRPGHGDFAGMLKFGTGDARDVLERASARESAARVAAGAVAKRLLDEAGVRVLSRVVAIGGVVADADGSPADAPEVEFLAAEDDPVRCSDRESGRSMMEAVDRAARDGDSLGGIFEVAAFGVVPGLGSAFQHDLRLDGRLAAALCSIPAVKGVEMGAGFALGSLRGSRAHDEMFVDADGRVYRKTNRAGGLEGGMTNGETVILRAAMKPIPTLAQPLSTVDVARHEPALAFKERADVCAVPAAAVIGEAVAALVLAGAYLEKFGGDSMIEMKRNFEAYLDRIEPLWKRRR
jgi:chorismate synthase